MTTRKTTRSEAIRIRVTPTELGVLKRAAKVAEREWSDWVRWVLKRAAKGKP